MNNADRIIRVLYKEADLASLFICADPDQIGPREAPLMRMVENAFSLEPNAEAALLDDRKDGFVDAVVQRYLRCYPSNYQQDEVELLLKNQARLLKRAYPASGANAAYLFPYYADRLFEVEDDDLYVSFDDLLEWNGFANKADAGIFYAAFDAIRERDRNRATYLPRPADARLASILRKGYAETHMHLKGSGYTPEISWYRFIRNAENPTARGNRAFEEFIAFFWGDRGAAARADSALAYRKIPLLRNLLRARACRPEGGQALLSQAEELLKELFLIRCDRDVREFGGKEGYRRLASSFAHATRNSSFQDPKSYLAFEQDFLKIMFEALLGERFSSLDRYAFNVYLAALTQFKFCVSQDNAGMGFTKFKRAEDHKDCFSGGSAGETEALYRSVFDKYYEEGGLRSVEFRIAPKGRKGLVETIDLLDRANDAMYERHRARNPRIRKIEYRLIIHFIKDSQPCCVDFGEARKERLLRKTRKSFGRIERFFESAEDPLPASSAPAASEGERAPAGGRRSYKEKIAGIDTANYEISCRPENFAPFFRRFAFDTAAHYDVGLTYHVGEDFATLCDGLRAIDDVMEFMALRRGDRLGHALALGLDVVRYFEGKRRYLITTLQDHVDDLAWMHQLIQAGASSRADLLSYLESQYSRFARRLCAPSASTAPAPSRRGAYQAPPLHVYQLAYALRGNDPACYRDGGEAPFSSYERKHRRSEAANEADACADARELFRLYQFSRRIKLNGSEPLALEADDEYLDAVAVAQDLVRAKVYRRGIAIEANPSSNRKISSVQKYIDLPIIAFNHHGLTLPDGFRLNGGHDLPITINTDDSAIFQTNLASEYALVAAALFREGFDREEAYRYLDHLRELSLHLSFVHTARPQ